MATQVKKELVAELVEKIKKAQSVVFVDYQGIKVNEETSLRKQMRENGAEYLVAKNFDEILEGTTAFAFGYDDPAVPAKAVFNLAKEKAKAKLDVFKIKGGYLTGKKVSVKEVEELAKLPSREQLLSMLLNSMLGPIRKLAYATVAIADKKEGSAE